jgi:hypothetical protein
MVLTVAIRRSPTYTLACTHGRRWAAIDRPVGRRFAHKAHVLLKGARVSRKDPRRAGRQY